MNLFRKFFVLTILATTLAAPAFAQSSIGIRGGTNIGILRNFSTTEGEGLELEERLFFGNYNALSFELGLTPWLALQPEFTYLQKGTKLSAEDNDVFDLKLTVNYVEAPLLLKFRLGEGPLKFYVTAGPGIGYALNGETELEIGEMEFTDKIDFDDSFGTDGRKDNRWDLSAIAGVGLQYRVGPGSIVLDARAAYDLNHSERFENGAPADYQRKRWESVSASLGYQFEFGGK